MDDSRLDDLLDRYQELLDAGRVPNLAELCRDCPDLRDELGKRVVRLHKLGAVLGDAPPAPPPEPEPLSLSDDKTWVSGTAPGGEGMAVEIPAPPGYEVVEPLGEGGMGVVYKARQVGLNRLVALKMILGGSRARAIDLTRFRDEAQAIAALRHPNIVQIYEVGEYRGQPFFSLEFCAGGTLAKALNGEPQPPDGAAGMTEVLARAIQSAHERNIIHRDLKPGNVLLAVEGEGRGGGQSTMVGEAPADVWRHLALRDPQAAFKITDFGLAKRVDDDSGRTLDGSVVGTPSYMAPEQARGETRAIGKSSDVWALGAVLYELLAGRPPFRGSTVLDTLEQVRARDPVPVRQLQPKVPADLETVCLKCLEKEPARRYASAGDLADDLRRFLAGRPIQARPVGHVKRAWRWCRREPRTAGLVAALVLLAGIIPALLVGYGLRLTRAEERVEEERKASDVARGAERAAHEVAETHRYYAAINAAARLRAQPRAGWRDEAVRQALAAAATDTADRDPVAVRTELAAALGAIDLRRIDGVADGQQAGALAFAPNGRLAVAPQLSQPFIGLRFVALVDPAGKVERKLPFPGTFGRMVVDSTTALAFSPTGRWLFLGLRSGTVFRWDLDAPPNKARVSFEPRSGPVAAFAFSPDSQWVYTAGHYGQVKRWPTDGPADAPAATWPSNREKPEGKRRTGLVFWTGSRPGVLAFGPAGATLLDPMTLRPRGPGDGWVAPAIDGSAGEIAAHPASGTLVVQRETDLDVVYWERAICQTVTRLRDPLLESGRAHIDRIEGMALHPSGLLLATVCPNGGQAKLWDLATGELACAVPAPGGRAVAFSADGRTLAVGGDHTTTRYELCGLREQTYVGRRGLPIKAVGRTAAGDLATIAAVEHPDKPQHARTVASVWGPDGTLRATVLHRAEGPLVDGHYRVAASPKAHRTAFHAADGALTWWDPPAAPKPAGSDVGRGTYFDLSLDPAGRAWSLEGGDRLGVREPASGGPAKVIACGSLAGGRRDVVCVRAGVGLAVAGCDDGFLRVVPAAGGRVQECPCFVDSPDTWLTERANTVRAVDVTDDATRAVAGTEDGRLWLVGLPAADRLAYWPAHFGRVTAVAFGPDGQWLASGGRDREVRLWKRMASGYELYVTLPVGRPVRQVVFSADGQGLVVLREGDSAVRVWHLDELHKWFRGAGLDG